MSAHTRWTTLACGLLLAALAAPAKGQLVASGSSGWLAFVGCWEPIAPEGDAGLLCFRTSGDGVEMSNLFEGDVTATERLVADGVARPVSAEGCTGTESVDFSEDGRRVFTSSSFVCGDGESRAGSGVMSFIAPTQWIDVRSLVVDGESVAWVQRYSAATRESLEEHGGDDPTTVDRAGVRSRRVLAARDIDIADVEEAVARVDAEAVKIWLATHETELDVSGAELIRLADAGVPEDVIDVMVAVSFPERFALTPEGVPQGVVDRVSSNAYQRGGYVGFRSFLWDPFYAPIGYSYRYSRFGYYGYGYGSGFGGGYYGYVPASIIVVPRDLTRVGRAGGRMVRGQGYRGPSSGGSASSGGGSGGSSGGAVRSSGGSSAPASAGSAPRRTAKPRGGG